MEPTTAGSKGISTVLIIVVMLILGGIGYWVATSNNSDEADDQESTSPSPSASASLSPTTSPTGAVSPSTSPTRSATPKPTVTPTTQGQTKTFNVSGSNFSFSVKEMRVKKGDKVKVVFTNTNGTHDWVIDAFNARTPQIGSGQTATVEFVADKTGTFEYYCSVGSHRALGMKGNLIVE